MAIPRLVLLGVSSGPSRRNFRRDRQAARLVRRITLVQAAVRWQQFADRLARAQPSLCGSCLDQRTAGAKLVVRPLTVAADAQSAAIGRVMPLTTVLNQYGLYRI